MKILMAILFVLSYNYSFAQNDRMEFQVMEDSTKKIIPFATIKIYKNHSLIHESISDSLGEYVIENIMPDTIDVSCEAKFYQKAVKKGIIIVENKIYLVPFYLKSIKD